MTDTVGRLATAGSAALIEPEHYKDAILDRLAEHANVAQFVSFEPTSELTQRYCRVFGYVANHRFKHAREAVHALLQVAPERSVNVRSFIPDDPRSHPFIYGINKLNTVMAHLADLARQGYCTIVNETVDVNDGGVSGVLEGGVLEFAPGVVPRFVEKSTEDEIPAIPKRLGVRILATVYGFEPSLDYEHDMRTEFSIHPRPRGWRRQHTIIWEEERVGQHTIPAHIIWPNAFSQFIGDKAFGLLVAEALGLPVPRCTVFPRRSPPGVFVFGESTGAKRVWMRTCPRVQIPGRYATLRGWRDPFELMREEDPRNKAIVSCLAQEDVKAAYAGALLTSENGEVTIEGVRGYGDAFMQGKKKPGRLPKSIVSDIEDLQAQAAKVLGPVRMEWVHDGERPWVLQLHAGTSASAGRVIFPGEPRNFREFCVDEGLEKLRALVAEARNDGDGIKVIGNVGLTSHIADVLRRSRIPSRLVPAS